VDREHDGVALFQRNDLRPVCMRGRCSVSTNSPPGKSFPGSDSRNRDPAAETRVAVEVLMQAVKVARTNLQQQRRRSQLACVVALLRNSACFFG